MPDERGYVLYYSPTESEQSEESVTASGTNSAISAVLLTGFQTGVEYQFQVAARFDGGNGDIVIGQRSELTDKSVIVMSTPTAPGK